MRKRSILITGHATSVSLEDEFWQALQQIAGVRRISLNTLITQIDHARNGPNLSSAIRVFVLQNAIQPASPGRRK